MSDSEEERSGSPFSWKPSKYNPLAPALFLTYVGSPLSFFVFDDRISKQRLEELIFQYGGDVCTDSIGLTSIILVNEKCKVHESWGPVYSREYVRDCTSAFNLLALEDYLIKGCRPPDCSNVMYGLFEGRFTFRNSTIAITRFSKIWLPNVNTIPTPSPSNTSLHQNSIEEGTGHGEPTENKSNAVGNAASSIVVIANSETKKQDELNNHSSGSRKKRKLPFSGINESFIQSSDPKESLDIYESEANASSSQSQLNFNSNTKNKSKKQNCFNPVPADPFNSSDEDSLNPQLSVSAQADRLQRDNIQDSDSDDCLPDLIRWTKFPGASKYYKVDKHTKTRFSRCEKEAILKYIVNSRSYSRLKSDALYREMEAKNICPKRTYQSLKNHFIKTLLLELDTFEFLTDNVKRKLRGEVW